MARFLLAQRLDQRLDRGPVRIIGRGDGQYELQISDHVTAACDRCPEKMSGIVSGAHRTADVICRQADAGKG